MKRKYAARLLAMLTCMMVFGGCSKAEPKVPAEPEVPVETKVPVEPEVPTEPEGAMKEHVEETKDAEEKSEVKKELCPLTISLKKTYAYEMDDDTILSYHNFTEAALAEADAEKLPELSAALAEYSTERKEEASRFYEMILEEAQDTYDELFEHESDTACDTAMEPHFLGNDILVRRADSAVVSFLEEETSFGGGVRSNSDYRGVTFDAAAGQRLGLTEVISDISALSEVLGQKLRKNYPEIIFSDLGEYLDRAMAAGGEELSWTLGYDGITFYFSPCDMASDIDTLLTASIGFMEMPELFVEKYTMVPEEYAVSFDMTETLEFNLDEDAELEQLQVCFEADEWGSITSVMITLDGKEYLDEEYYAYQGQPYLLRANGRYYLYLDGTAENDYRVMRVYELNQNEIFPIETLWSAGVHSLYLSDGTFITELPTNPNRFVLDSRMDALSTAAAGRVYHVGADGLPEAETEYYTLNHEIVLTSKLPLTVDVVNPETGEILESAAELPAGTRLMLYQTDNQTYADMRLEDGRVCRFAVDLSNGWPQLVNGMDAEACFEGMIFAG